MEVLLHLNKTQTRQKNELFLFFFIFVITGYRQLCRGFFLILQFFVYLQNFPPLPRPLASVQTEISVLYLICQQKKKNKKKIRGRVIHKGFQSSRGRGLTALIVCSNSD